MSFFNPTILSDEDYNFAHAILGTHRLQHPDLVIAPDGSAYLYRWHIIPRNNLANAYFHVQVDSDPERPLHDHPWDNTSVIISGGYEEWYDLMPAMTAMGAKGSVAKRKLEAGNVVYRAAKTAHRLILPPAYRYAMTLFSTGPHVRDWGFWFKDGWKSHHKVLAPLTNDLRSIMREEYRAD